MFVGSSGQSYRLPCRLNGKANSPPLVDTTRFDRFINISSAAATTAIIPLGRAIGITHSQCVAISRCRCPRHVASPPISTSIRYEIKFNIKGTTELKSIKAFEVQSDASPPSPSPPHAPVACDVYMIPRNRTHLLHIAYHDIKIAHLKLRRLLRHQNNPRLCFNTRSIRTDRPSTP